MTTEIGFVLLVVTIMMLGLVFEVVRPENHRLFYSIGVYVNWCVDCRRNT